MSDICHHTILSPTSVTNIDVNVPIFSFPPNHPHAQDSNDSNNQIQQPTPEPLVAQKFKFAWVLIANCLACLHSLKKKESPRDRPRINHPPEFMIFTDKNHEDVEKRIPRASDLGCYKM